MTRIETCDHVGCGKPAEYQVQFNDRGIFSSLAASILDRPLPKSSTRKRRI